MTSQQKTSRADTVRQRRNLKQPVKPVSKRTSQTARQSYRPASVFLPVEPRPVPPSTLRRTFGVSSPTKVKGAPFTG